MSGSDHGPPLDRFLRRIVVDAGCWIWTGCKDGDQRNGDDPKGQYGRFALDGYHMMGAHRAAWILFKGPIPDDLQVCHKCDHPPCVNPDHLFLGTNQDNIDDAVRKGRAAHQKPGYVSPRTGTGVGRFVSGRGVVTAARCVICGAETYQRVAAQREGRACVCRGNSTCKAIHIWRRRRGEAA